MPGHRECICSLGRSGLCLVVIEDQSSRVGKFQSHMLCVSLKKLFTSHTVLSLAAHPDQGVSHSQSNFCRTRTTASVGLSNSIFQWVLERLTAKEMSPQELVFSIGFLNRYCSSLYCREAAEELVMLLAPLCLSSLANTFIEFYLDKLSPEFLLFDCFPLSWCDKRLCVDYVRSIPQNFDLLVTVATVPLSTGVLYLLAHHDYDPEYWLQCVENEALSFESRASLIRIDILSNRSVLKCGLRKQALRFFCNVEQAISGLFLLASSLEQLDIVTISAGVTRGRTYRVDINVVSENIDDWPRWSREPERV